MPSRGPTESDDQLSQMVRENKRDMHALMMRYTWNHKLCARYLYKIGIIEVTALTNDWQKKSGLQKNAMEH